MALYVDDKLVEAAHALAGSENEADIVQKLMVPLLAVLGFGPQDFVPEQYVRAFTIGKGKAKREGYRPDHLIRLEGYTIAVIEAKKSSIKVMEGWREAVEYANHLNRNQPWTSAIDTVVACNGRELAIGTTSTPDSDVVLLNLAQALTHQQMLNTIEQAASRQVLLAKATEVRIANGKRDASSPRSVIFQTAAVPRDTLNPISGALKQVLDRYFVDIIGLADDDFREAYCDVSRASRHRDIEDVARDRPPGQIGANRLTRETIDEQVGNIVRRFHADNVGGQGPTQADRFLLVLGDPGAGKSTLLDWYRRFSNDHTKVCFVRFDGTRGPQEPGPLYDHLLKMVVEEAEAFFKRIVKPKSSQDAIREILNYRWHREYEELYKPMPKEKYLSDHFPALVKEIRADRAEYLALVLEALRKRTCSVCVILDNLDQTNIVKQVEGFRTLRPFAEQFSVCCIMALREETYRIHENNEPFNAFHRAPVFHVPAPLAADVIGRRLGLMKAKFGESDHSLGSYRVGDLTVEISQRSAVRYLRAVYGQLRRGEEAELSLIDGICGHDIRKALDAFRAVCTSSRIGEETNRAVHLNFEEFEPSYDAIIRAIVCGEWRYYSRESPLVANVFRLVQGADGASILYTLRLLRVLNDFAPDTHQYGKGYVDIPRIKAAMDVWGVVDEAAIRRLIFDLHPTGVWQVETLRPSNYTDFSLVRLQIPGLFLLLSLYRESAYLDCMAFDTTIEDEETLEHVVECVRNDQDASSLFRGHLSGVEQSDIERMRQRGIKDNEVRSRFFVQ